MKFKQLFMTKINLYGPHRIQFFFFFTFVIRKHVTKTSFRNRIALVKIVLNINIRQY